MNYFYNDLSFVSGVPCEVKQGREYNSSPAEVDQLWVVGIVAGAHRTLPLLFSNLPLHFSSIKLLFLFLVYP